jgi:hypothetical protein
MTYLKACSDKRRLGGELVQAARNAAAVSVLSRQTSVLTQERYLHLLTEAADAYGAADRRRGRAE